MQINYSNKSVRRDLEKTRTNFEAFMGEKLKANLRVKIDEARSISDLTMAMEGVLLEEWPLIRRKATFLSHEQKEETYNTYSRTSKI